MSNFHRALVFLQKHGIKVLPDERKFTLSTLSPDELQVHEIDIEAIRAKAKTMVELERVCHSCTHVIDQAKKIGFLPVRGN